MDEVRLGRTLRAIRIRRGWRQVDLAVAAGLSHATISRLERGRLGGITVVTLAAIVRPLDATLDVTIRWNGGDLPRLIAARHAALHEAFARMVSGLDGWRAVPEVSFNSFGERGIIDVALWHAVGRILVVVELKTEIVDVNELMGSVDRKRRHGPMAVRDRGWRPSFTGAWVVLADGRTNRRHLADHRTVLRSAFPVDGRTMGAWLRRPVGPVAALTFLPVAHGRSSKPRVEAVRRVRLGHPGRGHDHAPRGGDRPGAPLVG